jgi:hypothetical protein
MKRVAAVLLAALTLTKGAQADEADKVRCAASYELVQSLRRDDKLSEALDQAHVCAATCPEGLKTDCRKWSAEIEALMPSARVEVVDASGTAIANAWVTIDGRAVEPNTAITLVPGSHGVHVEASGHKPGDQTVVIHGADRDRVVRIALERTLVAAPPHARSRTASVVLGTLGLVALGTAGALTIAGHVLRTSLLNGCGKVPDCSQTDVDTIATMWWVATGLAIAGATTFTIAVAVWPFGGRAASSVAVSLPFQ